MAGHEKSCGGPHLAPGPRVWHACFSVKTIFNSKRRPPVKGMFLGPKPKLAHFWLICLLDYITLIDKNFDPKTHPSCPLDLKNEKKTLFFSKDHNSWGQ